MKIKVRNADQVVKRVVIMNGTHHD
jgi:hypothetical protein